MNNQHKNKCPQCSIAAQQEVFTINEVGMQISCDEGHITTALIKFNITEVTITDAKTGHLIRFEKIKAPEALRPLVN